MTRARKRARAAYGGGTIEQRGTSWWIRYSEGVGSERKRWRDGPFRSESEAKAQRDRGTPLQGTAATPADEWLMDWAKRTRDELIAVQRESDAAYKFRHVRLHLAPRLRGIRIGDIRAGDLRQMFQNLLDSGMAPKTVSNIRGTLSVALGDAVGDGLLATNPVPDAKLRKHHRGIRKPGPAPWARRKVLEPDELERFVTWCLANEVTNRWAIPLLLIANTGMRRGEALGVAWDRVDFARRLLTIDQQVEQLDDGSLVVRPVKTEQSNRIIELTPGTVALLRRLRARQRVVHMDGLIFTDRSGKPYIPDSLTQYVCKNLRAKLQMPDKFSPHALRHTHASGLLEDGVDEAVVAARLGHSSAYITQLIYNHATTAGDGVAASKWARRVGE